jgi:hypothetical protein
VWQDGELDCATWMPRFVSFTRKQRTRSSSVLRYLQINQTKHDITVLPTLGKLSGQSCGKIWLLRKKIRAPTKFSFFEGISTDENFVICVYVLGKSIICFWFAQK